MAKQPSLDAAYALQTPDDSRRLYGEWAKSYDAGFADAMAYELPAKVANLFDKLGGEGPVLDVGAGTGLLAAALRAGPIDALDVSAEMLQVAGEKGLYRNLIEADLTKPLAMAANRYNGIVSSGTFTHGHVGPDALDGLLEVARPGALFALSVNAQHFSEQGFAAKFDSLAARITEFQLHSVPIYGTNAASDHAGDKAHIATFKRL